MVSAELAQPAASSPAPSRPDISLIIPVFNEVGGIDRCHNEVARRLEQSPYSFELIFVDDGSTDGSAERLRALAIRDDRVTLVKLLSNVGQQQAMYAALRYAEGRAVITYDSDLQFHPDCVPELAAKVFEGYDIVGGVRTQRKDPLIVNRLPSWIGRKLINKALRIELADFGGVKAYSARMVDVLLRMDAPRIVLPAMAYSVSRNAIEIPVRHQPRRTNRSKWSIWSRMEVYFDVYTLYARRPFAWMMLGGAVCLAAGLLLGLGVLLYWTFVTSAFGGLIIFFDMFLLATGAYLFSLALIGEFVVRGFRGSHLRADQLIEEVVTSRRREKVGLATVVARTD
jgi:glycosyltransferase involved in cell wall biosynthesis